MANLLALMLLLLPLIHHSQEITKRQIVHGFKSSHSRLFQLNPKESSGQNPLPSSISRSTSTLDPKENATRCGGIMLPKDYNRLVLPVSKDGGSTYIYVTLFIRSVTDIDEINGILTVDVDLGLNWREMEIYAFNEANNWINIFTNAQVGNTTYDYEALKCIWKPDIFIDEMVSAEETSVLSKMVQVKFLPEDQSGDGDIVFSGRMTLKLNCGMDFSFYPADTQMCVYHIRSYSHKQDQLQLLWGGESRRSSIFLLEDSNPNFDIQVTDVEPWIRVHDYTTQESFDRFRKGNYSTLKFAIKARRHLSYHLVQTYLPSVLLVLITWLCFLLPSNMVEPRIGISMTTVLTLTAMFAAVRQQSPKVSHTMAIDIWMVFNIFVIFIALSLFNFIYWMKLRLKRKQTTIEKGELDDLSEDNIRVAETYRNFVKFTRRYVFRNPNPEFNTDEGNEELLYSRLEYETIQMYRDHYRKEMQRKLNYSKRLEENDTTLPDWVNQNFLNRIDQKLLLYNDSIQGLSISSGSFLIYNISIVVIGIMGIAVLILLT